MLRRSLLFIPSSSPRMVQNADVFESDCVIFDLEDGVSLSEKDSALLLLRNALNRFDFPFEKIVRINSVDSPYFENDLKVMLESPIDMIMLPKATVESMGILLEKTKGKKIKIMALIESALGVEQVFDILKHESVIGLLFGGEDYAANLGIKRTKDSHEIQYARQRVVNAAVAHGKIAIDTPFTDVLDDEGLAKDTQYAKSIGFTGKSAINPNQVNIINDVFNPTREEIDYATLVIDAEQEAKAKGLGVFSVNGKMVDAPIILRAQQTISKAKKVGLI